MPRKTESTSQVAGGAASGPSVTATFQMPPAAAAKPEIAVADEQPSFWEKMYSIPKSEWADNCTLWIYRLEPRTRMIPGERGYLDILTEPISPDYIKKRWGGGRFRIILNRSGKIYAKIEEDIEGEPIYDRREAANPQTASGVNGNGNGSLDGNVLKVLEQQNERLYQVLTTLQGAKEENPAIGNAVDMLTSAYKTGLSAVATGSGAGAADPTKQLEVMLSLAEKILSVRGGGGNSLNETITLLTTLGVIAKPKTLAEQLAEMKSLQELVSGGGEPKDWKAAAVQAVTQHLPEILDTFKAPAVAAQARAAEAGARARAAEALRVVPIDRSQPATQPAAQPPAHAPAPAPAAPTITVEGGLNLEPRDAAAVVEQPAPVPTSQEQYDESMKVQIVNMFRLGASGSAIAAFLEDIKPELAEDLKKYPAQTVTEFFSKDPVLRLMVADPRWSEVLADAREYLTEEVLTN